MSNNLNLIDYNITLDILIYSILIYKIDIDNKKTLDEIIDEYNKNSEKSIYGYYLKNINKNDKIIKCFYCTITHIHCIILKNEVDKKIKIIFKGTTDNIHLEYNLKLKLKSINFLNNDKIKIHTGFYEQIFKGRIYNKIIKYLKTLDLNNYFIFCGGHSLGGVMSTLFGFFASYIFTKNKIIIISYGSCRIGNKYFRKSFEKRENIICYRIINEGDIIIKLPIINYEHVGIPIKLNLIENNLNPLENHTYQSYFNNLLNTNW